MPASTENPGSALIDNAVVNDDFFVEKEFHSEDDIMSITATENDFNEEPLPEKPAKKRSFR